MAPQKAPIPPGSLTAVAMVAITWSVPLGSSASQLM
jgi:hypothetical protein